MISWPKAPLIYEINTWPWLNELSHQTSRTITLATVPGAVWDRIAELGFHAVWLMGVWERSRAGIAIGNRNPAFLAELRRALPDYEEADNIGSAYCIRRYRVSRRLGGPEGLAAARAALARRGMRLILDFVPNHIAPDHPWVKEHPEFLVPGDSKDLADAPEAFIRRGGRVFACGRDPFFPPWNDVLQLNAFHGGQRAAAKRILDDIARQCDGVRCDMAMLLLNSVFERTWGTRAGRAPRTEYWEEIIPEVHANYLEFKFIAEVYWDRERELHRQGFDFCYDKRVYDHLVRGEPDELRKHLASDSAYQSRLVRFIENHDEPRAVTSFTHAQVRAALVAVLTLPGARLVHEGQIEGRQQRLPVCLGRRPPEAVDAAWADFHIRLLSAIRNELPHDGEWRLCEWIGSPGDPDCLGLISWCWSQGLNHWLIVVNLSEERARGTVRLPWTNPAGTKWRLSEVLSSESHERADAALREFGVVVDLQGFAFRWFRFERFEP